MSIVGGRGSYRYVGVRYREDRSLDPNGRKWPPADGLPVLPVFDPDLPVAYGSYVLARIPRSPRLPWVLVAARLRARVQIATLFGVYSCSLRALQRYRSSSPQWGHLSAVS